MPRKVSFPRSEFAKAYADLKSQGRTGASIAEELGISGMTLLRWKKADVAPNAFVTVSRRRGGEDIGSISSDTEAAFDANVDIKTLQLENRALRKLLAKYLIDEALSKSN